MTEDHALEPLHEVVDVHSSIDSHPTYVLNGALYLASRSFLLREHSFICKDTVCYVMPPDRSVYIDTQLDWHGKGDGALLMAKTLVTGADGFIGSHLVQTLLHMVTTLELFVYTIQMVVGVG